MRYADEVLAVDRELRRLAAASRASASSRWRASSSTRSSGEFDPEKYHDEYREEVLALIERKAAGEEIVAPPRPRSRPRCSTSWPRSRRAWPAPAPSQWRVDRRAKRTAKKAAAKKAPAKTTKKSTAKKATGTAKRTRKSA